MAKISKMDRQRGGTQLNQSDLSEPPKGERLRNTDKNGETWFGAGKKEGGGEGSAALPKLSAKKGERVWYVYNDQANSA